MEVYTKVKNSTIFVMEKESSAMLMEEFMMEIGKKEIWMDMENFIILMKNLLMKGSGNKMHLKEKEKFLMKILNQFKEDLIAQILII